MQPSSAQSSEPAKPPSIGARVWDALALLVVAFAIWKIFVAPRSFIAAHRVPAPAAVFERLDGKSFRLADQRGHTVFLDFFASWCAPCKVELPLVQSWAAHNPHAAVVAVDVGEKRSVVEEYARRMHLRFVALDPESSARALFSVVGLPTVVVIDRHGDVRARWEGLNPAIGLAMTNAESKL
ncbi:MAG: TlpA family protein disulfide reductase [Candidatus Eremiobacteraeota bacterium]|nr:TlpA family protein disulfide reductase [Candidatus Eremiobacteraeota bacterium]